MRIGYYTSIEGWGGSESHLLSLMEMVRKQGHEPVLFGIEGTRLFSECRTRDITCVAWKRIGIANVLEEAPSAVQAKGCAGWRQWLRLIPVPVRVLLGFAKDLRRLACLIRKNPCDVIHVSINGYETAGLACRLIGTPCLGWHCIMPVYDPMPLRRWLIRWTNRWYDKIGGMSQTCSEAWRVWCGLDKSRCVWAWNGIDISRFSGDRNYERVEGDRFMVLAAGRLHPMKGFDVLIRAIAELKNDNIGVWIAGEGAKEGELRRLVAELGLGDRVELLGHQEDMRRLYDGVACFVLPSVSHESFGIVLAEAMASGLPVITSDFGPLPEINLDEETGLVVPVGDAKALALAIKMIMDDPMLARRFGQAGRRRAEQCYSADKMVNLMLVLYQEIYGVRHTSP